MKIKQFLHFSTLLILFLTTFSTNIIACSGIFPEKPVCIKYSESQAVLIGEVIKTKTLNQKVGKNKFWEFRITTFKVEKQFKGDNQKTIDFITPVELVDSCDWNPEFKNGDKWLVYASFDEDEKKLKMHNYSWKYDQIKNKKDVEFLEKSTLGIRETSIELQIEYWTNLYPENVGVLDINISSNDLNLSTKTNKNGNFKLSNLSSGQYKISFLSPANSYTMNLPLNTKKTFIENSKQYLIENEIELQNGECIFSHFALGKLGN